MTAAVLVIGVAAIVTGCWVADHDPAFGCWWYAAMTAASITLAVLAAINGDWVQAILLAACAVVEGAGWHKSRKRRRTGGTSA